MINPEILSQSKYQARIIPISFEGTDKKVILAGSPISSKGVFANDGTAGGILLDDVSRDHPVGEIVIDGFVDFAVAQNHAGIEYTKECMTALKNIVFEGSEDKWIKSGATTWDELEGKPFYDEITEMFLAECRIGSATVVTGALNAEGKPQANLSLEATQIDVGETYIVTVDGVSYTGVAKEDPEFNSNYQSKNVCIFGRFNDFTEAPVNIYVYGDHIYASFEGDELLAHALKIVHKKN